MVSSSMNSAKARTKGVRIPPITTARRLAVLVAGGATLLRRATGAAAAAPSVCFGGAAFVVRFFCASLACLFSLFFLVAIFYYSSGADERATTNPKNISRDPDCAGRHEEGDGLTDIVGSTTLTERAQAARSFTKKDRHRRRKPRLDEAGRDRVDRDPLPGDLLAERLLLKERRRNTRHRPEVNIDT